MKSTKYPDASTIKLFVELPLDAAAVIWLDQFHSTTTPRRPLQLLIPEILERVADEAQATIPVSPQNLAVAECNLLACERSYEDTTGATRAIVKLFMPSRPTI